MLELLRQSLEADAVKRGEQMLAKLRAAQLRNQTFWLFHASASFACFCIILLARVAALKSPAHTTAITAIGLGLVAVLTAITLHLVHDHAFLYRVSTWYSVSTTRLRNRTKQDYLTIYRWATWFLALLPSLAAIFILLLDSSHIVNAGSPEHTAYVDTLKQLMTLATAVLATQVALFNFMFGQLLGRYSTTITREITTHPTVRLLQGFTIFMLVGLYFCFLWGFPDGLPRTTMFFVVALLSCLVLTVLVANRGIQADAAMRYAGWHIGNKVARTLLNPITKPTPFWKVMMYFGLDWRNPERIVVTVPPARPAELAIKMVAGIFNAAHRALRDNEHEMFVESMGALIRVADSYATGRSKYYGTGDAFFSYLDDHLSVLLVATSKAPNQYLITNVVNTTGTIGRIAMRLGGPVDKEKIEYPHGHPLFVHWFGLLMEGFDLSHTLMRSTAASEALEQMCLLTNAAILAGYGDQVRITVLPGIQKIHRTCLLTMDAYHSSLAGQCLIKLMKIWLFAIVQPAKIAAVASDHFSETVQEMVLLQQAIPRQPNFELKDPASVLTVKLAEDNFTLQDICGCVLAWRFEEDWQKRFATDKIAEIIQLLKTLTLNAKSDWAGVKSYTEAIYEISFLILKGLPDGLLRQSGNRSRYHQDDETPQEVLEQRIGDVTRELIEAWYGPKRDWYDCEHALFSIVGLASVAFKATGRAHAKTIALAIIERYSEMLDETSTNRGNIPDDHWDYLQLCAAWARDLLGEVALADKLVSDVAHGRPFYSGFHPGHSTAFGYPQVELGFAFFLPVPRNLQVSRSDKELFNRWQAMAVEPGMLHDTYERVWAIRGPLSAEIRSRHAAKKKQSSGDPSSSS
jgi:hypothetical protein